MYYRLTAYTKCVKCDTVIARTKQVETNAGFKYITENAPCRYIDKWGHARNYCKCCIK